MSDVGWSRSLSRDSAALIFAKVKKTDSDSNPESESVKIYRFRSDFAALISGI